MIQANASLEAGANFVQIGSMTGQDWQPNTDFFEASNFNNAIELVGEDLTDRKGSADEASEDYVQAVNDAINAINNAYEERENSWNTFTSNVEEVLLELQPDLRTNEVWSNEEPILAEVDESEFSHIESEISLAQRPP